MFLSTEVTEAVERLNTRVSLNLDELYKQMEELKQMCTDERKARIDMEEKLQAYEMLLEQDRDEQTRNVLDLKDEMLKTAEMVSVESSNTADAMSVIVDDVESVKALVNEHQNTMDSLTAKSQTFLSEEDVGAFVDAREERMSGVIRGVVQAMGELEPEMKSFRSRVDTCIEDANSTVESATKGFPLEIEAAEQRVTAAFNKALSQRDEGTAETFQGLRDEAQDADEKIASVRGTVEALGTSLFENVARTDVCMKEVQQWVAQARVDKETIRTFTIRVDEKMNDSIETARSDAKAVLENLEREKIARISTVDELIETVKSTAADTEARIQKLQVPEELAASIVSLEAEVSAKFTVAAEAAAQQQTETSAIVESAKGQMEAIQAEMEVIARAAGQAVGATQESLQQLEESVHATIAESKEDMTQMSSDNGARHAKIVTNLAMSHAETLTSLRSETEAMAARVEQVETAMQGRAADEQRDAALAAQFAGARELCGQDMKALVGRLGGAFKSKIDDVEARVTANQNANIHLFKTEMKLIQDEAKEAAHVQMELESLKAALATTNGQVLDMTAMVSQNDTKLRRLEATGVAQAMSPRHTTPARDEGNSSLHLQQRDEGDTALPDGTPRRDMSDLPLELNTAASPAPAKEAESAEDLDSFLADLNG